MDRGDHPGVKIHAVKPLKYKRLSINFCPEHHWRKMETAYYLGFVEKRDLTLQRIEAQYRWITNMMLSQALKEMEDYGLITRKQYMEIPPRVEYSLTEAGKDLVPSLQSLAKWGKHMQNQ
ncbi:hypothetical protein J31TS6_55650 [Brevibacillus reuszeri]|uniref:winged helix-turn-helix transcriptional regulator n=1 Tax=Brevibacillus reuszeri TaxID=54915 RepID=UPI001B151A61|nr:hypothetical protein J31TS6_55650 [Brevibacillus reuszeri]